MNKQISLRVLDLSNNQLSDRGAAELAAALIMNTSLRTLIIRDNDIGLQGGGMLGSSLHSNYHLLTMKSSGMNPFHPRLYPSMILPLLERNRRMSTEKELPRLEERREKLRQVPQSIEAISKLNA